MPDLKNVPPSPRPRRLSQLKDAWKNKRSVTIVYLLLRASVILVLIAQIFNRNFENVFLCVLTLFLFGVPNMVEHRLDIELPNTLEIIILLFIYAAEMLGERLKIENEPPVIRYLPLLGYRAAHPERFFVRGHRVLFA